MTARVSAAVAALALLAIAAGAAAADGPKVSQAWARATAPGVDVGAAYLTIDGGAADDIVEESGGVAKMRAVEGIKVPAGKRVALAPKGTHIMLMGLSKPLVAGESFPLELRFAKAGALSATVLVRPAGSDAPPPAPR